MDFNKLVNGTLNDKKIQKMLENPFTNIPDLETSIEISEKYNIALHPKYTYYWNELSAAQLVSFMEFLKKAKFKVLNNEIQEISFPKTKEKRLFEILAIEHTIKKLPINEIKSEEESEIIVLDKSTSKTFLTNLNINFNKFTEKEYKERIIKIAKNATENLSKSSVEIININSSIEIRDKGGTYIGARMGRPEKAKMRKQFNDETKSHGLFPVGEQGGRLKNIVEVLKTTGYIDEQFRIYYCNKCNKETIYPICEICSNKTQQKHYERYTFKEIKEPTENSIEYKKIKLQTESIEKNLRKILGSGIEYPKNVKGITSTINKHHTTEHIAKSFLRAINHVYVNKDGTVRYDMIEMGLTHFKPCEIGTSIEKLKELGYTQDYLGNTLENENQIIEIFPQDVILPDCIESGDEFASDYIINTAKYVDDLLEKLYNLPKFYNFKNKEDTIGHLIIGLAPHTSAGIVGRIIGYSKTQGCFSHPVWHAAQRRNLDGDENGIMLLLDGLINFSREFLPDRRGSRTMDISLVLTSHLYLDQIDDEVHGMDIVPYYPLEFYRATKKFINPKEIKIEKLGKRVDEKDIDKRYLGYFFTHNTNDMNNTVLCSSYKSVPSMVEKLDLQLGLAKKLRAVNENIVGTLIIDKHFMKDIKGNLRKFGMQTFRCTNCGEKYRRPPLIGKCVKCGHPSINFTIHEGSVKKYIEPSFKIVKEYDVDPYIVETLELANLRVEGLFGKETETQKNLSLFFK